MVDGQLEVDVTKVTDAVGQACKRSLSNVSQTYQQYELYLLNEPMRLSFSKGGFSGFCAFEQKLDFSKSPKT